MLPRMKLFCHMQKNPNNNRKENQIKSTKYSLPFRGSSQYFLSYCFDNGSHFAIIIGGTSLKACGAHYETRLRGTSSSVFGGLRLRGIVREKSGMF